MLFSIFPFTSIYCAIGVVQFTITIFFIILILSFIFFTLRPFKNSLTMHFIIQPFACILSSIVPCIHPITFYIIIVKISRKLTPVKPLKNAFSMFFTIIIQTGIFSLVGPYFCTFALENFYKKIKNTCC